MVREKDDGHENKKRANPVADDRRDPRESRPSRGDAPSDDFRSAVHGYLFGFCYRLKQKEAHGSDTRKVGGDGARRGCDGDGKDR